MRSLQWRKIARLLGTVFSGTIGYEHSAWWPALRYSLELIFGQWSR